MSLVSQAPAQRPFFRLSIAGPEAVRQAILPTNVGSLLSGRQAEMAANLLRSQIRGILGGVTGGDRVAAKEIEARLLGYAGRIEIELWPTEPLDPDADFEGAGRLIFWSDGETDIGAFCADLRRIAEASGAPTASIEVGGTELSIVGQRDGLGCSLPVPHGDGHAVMWFGTHAENAATAGWADITANWQAHTERSKAYRRNDLLTFQLDIAAIAGFTTSGLDRDEPSDAMILRFMGVDTYDMFGTTVSTNGPHLQLELSATFKPGHRGIYEAFLPSIDSIPDVLGRVPSGDAEATFACGHVRWRELWTCIMDFAANFSWFGSKTRDLDEIKADANKDAGFDIENDLLASVGTEVLLLFEPSAADADREDKRAPDADGIFFAVEIVDDEKFATVFPKLMRNPVDIDGSFEFGAATVFQGNFLDRDEYFAHVSGALLYGIGDRGLSAMERYITENASPQPKQPPGLRNVKRSLPPGWNLAAVVPTEFFGDTLFEEILWEMWKELRRELPFSTADVDRDTIGDMIEQMMPMLNSHRLDRICLLGGYEGSTARLRVVW